ncbi:hypothetical protein VNI00_017613 [Paramarasmius palmivorus]|uniref:Uncharacterized protein n=1 Tax=Paramarasmius palmivorus TaxID=297713 RepID=A0AAW0B5Y9_9AGAR
MGGFALYDGDEFQSYLWNDSNGDVNSDMVEIIHGYHQKSRANNIELDVQVNTQIEELKRKEEDADPMPETDKTRLITGPKPEDRAESEKSNTQRSSTLMLEYLLQNGNIRTTEDEIMGNLSHSDSITKVIAVIQTAWFLLQVGARAVEGLAITELEIITVGFAVLNFGTYFLWWNKPLRVRHPERVYWRQQAPVSVDTTRKVEHTKIRDRVWANVVRFWTSIWDEIEKVGKSMVALFNFLRLDVVGDQLNQESILKIDWIALLHLVGLPFLVVLHLIMASIFIIIDTNDDYMAYVVNSSRLKKGSATLYILVYGLTTLFGAIHCIPWNFQFPTHKEQLLWRISAGGLVVLPVGLTVVIVIIVMIAAFVECCGRDSDEFMETSLLIFDVLLLPIAYFVARVVLMVLALMELRNLPPSAYQTVEWTTFIPHIG